MKSNRWGYVGFAVLLVGSLIPLGAHAQEPRPCIPAEAVASADAAQLDEGGDIATKMSPLLQAMQTLSEKGGNDNRPLSQLLTPAEQAQFNTIRRNLIILQGRELAYSYISRDTRIIADLERAAEADDLFELDRKSLPTESPLLFYLSILDALRQADADPPEVTVSTAKSCDISVSLTLIEQFNSNEIASQPTNGGIVKLILDLRRLKEFDVVATRNTDMLLDYLDHPVFAGEDIVPNHAYDDWLKTQPVSINAISIVYARVTNSLPGEVEIKDQYQARRAEEINENYGTAR